MSEPVQVFRITAGPPCPETDRCTLRDVGRGGRSIITRGLDGQVNVAGNIVVAEDGFDESEPRGRR
jgi:hypothetical protein